jgi:hypothetical protein
LLLTRKKRRAISFRKEANPPMQREFSQRKSLPQLEFTLAGFYENLVAAYAFF